MATDGQGGYAFIVLLEDSDDAAGLARLLEDVRLPNAGSHALFITPPVRGMAFFADEAQQPILDQWWGSNVQGTAHPVYLMMHAEGLPEWPRGVDGTFYVSVPDAGVAARYADSERVQVLEAAGLLDFAAAVMRDFSGGNGTGVMLFDEAEALRMASLSSRFPLDLVAAGQAGVGAGAPAAGPHHDATPAPAVSSGGPITAGLATPHPFDLLAADALQHPLPAAPIRSPEPAPLRPEPIADVGQRGRAGFPLAGFSGFGGLIRARGRRRGFAPSSDQDLARAMVERGTTIVVMGSRKGGVGKTSFAAGVAIVAGTVLDQVGHKAAIVDANIANPDAWGQMNLRDGAATVRDVVTALTANREPPPPVHATTPALACYPESREATEYSKTDVLRFADYLRRRYTWVVVDMSNRLPDPMAGPEAAAAAFWLEHGDVLILPTTSAKADFNGVLDYLDVRDLPPTVVPYIIPSAKRLRENPVTQEYLRVIRTRAQRVVDIPDEANVVRLAGMEGVPVEQLSSRLRLAYRELTEVVCGMPARDS